MIANLIGGFIAILVGTSLVGPIADNVDLAADVYTGNLTNLSSWGGSVLYLVPGFFSLGRQAGIV